MGEIKAQAITHHASLITHYPKVSIVVLNWNGLNDTVECLESLRKITYPNYEVIVVDNGSTGNDAGALAEKFGDYIHLIRNNKNAGYSGGNNMGTQYALTASAPDYVLVLNNDIVVAPDFLTELVGAAGSDDQVGLVGPKTYVYGTQNTLELVWYEVDMCRGAVSHVGRGEIDRQQYEDVIQVNYVQGSCLLMARKVIRDVGLFDEDYFCYWDETDYCFRVRDAGYKIFYAPAARIWHKKFVRSKPWYRTLAGKNQVAMPPYYFYFMTRNNFRFVRKHAAKRQYFAFLLYFFGYRFWFMTGVCLLYYRDVRRLRGFYRGAKDGALNSLSGARYYTGG